MSEFRFVFKDGHEETHQVEWPSPRAILPVVQVPHNGLKWWVGPGGERREYSSCGCTRAALPPTDWTPEYDKQHFQMVRGEDGEHYYEEVSEDE